MSKDTPERRRKLRRKLSDRRNKKMDDLFKKAVARGDLEDIRKGDRRKKRERRTIPAEIKVYLN